MSKKQTKKGGAAKKVEDVADDDFDQILAEEMAKNLSVTPSETLAAAKELLAPAVAPDTNEQNDEGDSDDENAAGDAKKVMLILH